MNFPEEAIEAAAQEAHAEICEESWEDCSDADWGYGKCWKAALAALKAAAPLLMAQALREMAEAFEPMDADQIKSWHPHDVAELLRWRAADITA